MILRELKINNFRSYYKESLFTFKDGLTLIIGGNGDGKTTFFDALDWLFATDKENKSLGLVSEKRKSEMSVGETDIVSVSLEFEHNGLKSLEKSFRFEMLENGDVITRDFSFKGWDGVGSEREMTRGSYLVDNCFDAYIRKYSLFKGETTLNVFNDDTALKVLVERFSNIRQFDDYVELLSSCENKSQEAYDKEVRSDKRLKNKATILKAELTDVKRRIADTQSDIKRQEAVRDTYAAKIESIEQYEETSEKYNEIKQRIKSKQDQLASIRSNIKEDYSIKLLDESWILSLFPSVFSEYTAKISAFGKQKRKLEKEFIIVQAKKEERAEIVEEVTAIANGAVPLSKFVPDNETMQEMIDDEICKVCNRVAKKGSEAHNFMKEKLAQYLKSVAAKNETNAEVSVEKSLFTQSFIEELHTISISLGGSEAQKIANLSNEIRDCIEFNASRKEDEQKVLNQLNEAEDEKTRLLIQSNGVSEDVLEASYSDLKGYFNQQKNAEQKLVDLTNTLKDLIEKEKSIKGEYDELNPTSETARIYSKVHGAFDKILKAFERAKKANLQKFLEDLEKRANDYLEKLNIDDFHGVVKIIEKANGSAQIKLRSSNGVYIDNPNGALLTTMYMSVLFAISDLTTLKRDEDYPLIFDAPTSSFESFKEEDFYNVIDKINKQCIIVTKDLLDKDPLSGERKLNKAKIESLTCSVYRIQKLRPFDSNDLSTICTISKPIK